VSSIEFEIPDGFGIPLVDLDTDLLPQPTMDALDALYAGGGGGGAVDSVNGQTGVVVLDADDIADGTTNHAFTAADDTKLAGIATAATANSSDATLLARANHTGTQTASTISDFSTAADARVNSLVPASSETAAGKAEIATSAEVTTGTDDARIVSPLKLATRLTALAYAPLASPALTGNPTAPTASPGDNDTSIATTAFVTAADVAADALLIPKSLVDAKGDILTATANDTPARLAVGTDGHVLTADSAQATGVKWAAAAGGGVSKVTPRVRNRWYMPEIPIDTYDGGGTPQNGTAELLPFYVGGGSQTFDRIGFNLATVGEASSVMRLGIYGANADGMPGTLSLDAGTVAIDASPDDKALTISHALADGLWWLLMVHNDSTNAVRVRKTAGSYKPYQHFPYGSASMDFSDGGISVRTTGWTAGSALPGTASLTGMSGRLNDFPIIWVRRAA
jgi:hypothetical protein